MSNLKITLIELKARMDALNTAAKNRSMKTAAIKAGLQEIATSEVLPERVRMSLYCAVKERTYMGIARELIDGLNALAATITKTEEVPTPKPTSKQLESSRSMLVLFEHAARSRRPSISNLRDGINAFLDVAVAPVSVKKSLRQAVKLSSVDCGASAIIESINILTIAITNERDMERRAEALKKVICTTATDEMMTYSADGRHFLAFRKGARAFWMLVETDTNAALPASKEIGFLKHKLKTADITRAISYIVTNNLILKQRDKVRSLAAQTELPSIDFLYRIGSITREQSLLFRPVEELAGHLKKDQPPLIEKEIS